MVEQDNTAASSVTEQPQGDISTGNGPTTSTSDAGDSENSIPKTAATSSVTSDLPSEAGEDQEAQQKAFDELPGEQKASIGLIKVDGIDFRYVGVSPGRDEHDASEMLGISVSTLNSTFTPLAEVQFSRSIRVKDPSSGNFYFPTEDCTSWKDCQLEGSYLIER